MSSTYSFNGVDVVDMNDMLREEEDVEVEVQDGHLAPTVGIPKVYKKWYGADGRQLTGKAANVPPKGLTPKEASAAFFAEVKAIPAVASCVFQVRKTRGESLRGPCKTTKNFSNNMPSTSQALGHDKMRFSYLCQAIAKEGEGASSSLKKVAKLAGRHFAGHGPTQSLYNRLIKGLGLRPLVVEEAKDLTNELYHLAYKNLPFKREDSHLDEVIHDTRAFQWLGLQLPKHSAMGLPWPGYKRSDMIPGDDDSKKMVGYKRAYALFTEMNNLLLTHGSKVLDYLDKNTRESEFTFMLCPKVDVYETSEWLEKTRPFYVTPAGLCVGFMQINQAWKGGIKSFWEDPDSHSALGFSWVGGGATKIVDWIESKKEPGFYFFSYSDDQFYLVIWKDEDTGELHRMLLAPDVKAMDMQHQAWHNNFEARARLSHLLGSPKCLSVKESMEEVKKQFEALKKAGKEEAAKNLLLFFRWITLGHQIMLRHVVALNGDETVEMRSTLPSGKPGTTESNQCASTLLGVKLSKVPLPNGKVRTLKTYIEDLKTAARQVGMTFKEESLTPQMLGKDAMKPEYDGVKLITGGEDDVVMLPFLGCTIKKRRLEYNGTRIRVFVPAANLTRLTTKYLFPLHSEESKKFVLSRIRADLAAFIGLTLSGGFASNKFYKRMKSVFDQTVIATKPALEEHGIDKIAYEISVFSEQEESAVKGWIKSLPYKFPPQSWFMALMLPPSAAAKLNMDPREFAAMIKSECESSISENKVSAATARLNPTLSYELEEYDDLPVFEDFSEAKAATMSAPKPGQNVRPNEKRRAEKQAVVDERRRLAAEKAASSSVVQNKIKTKHQLQVSPLDAEYGYRGSYSESEEEYSPGYASNDDYVEEDDDDEVAERLERLNRDDDYPDSDEPAFSRAATPDSDDPDQDGQLYFSGYGQEMKGHNAMG